MGSNQHASGVAWRHFDDRTALDRQIRLDPAFYSREKGYAAPWNCTSPTGCHVRRGAGPINVILDRRPRTLFDLIRVDASIVLFRVAWLELWWDKFETEPLLGSVTCDGEALSEWATLRTRVQPLFALGDRPSEIRCRACGWTPYWTEGTGQIAIDKAETADFFASASGLLVRDDMLESLDVRWARGSGDAPLVAEASVN